MSGTVPLLKRRPADEHLDSEPLSKRQKTNLPPSAFWEDLSRIWLTKDALQELDRRNRVSSVQKTHHFHRPLTRQSQAVLKHRSQTLTPDPLADCKPEHVREIKRISRRGGLDLADLRNFPDPFIPAYQSMSIHSSLSRKRRAPGSGNNQTTTKSSTTVYNRNFQQNLIDHGIYPYGYEYPDGRIPRKPDNLEEIKERLAQPRSSLSPSRFSDREFEKFNRADINASDEKPVVTTVVPFIEGDNTSGDPKCVGGDYVFAKLAHLTNGALAKAKPDHFFGARPEQLHPQIREDIGDRIVPSTRSDRPIAPNFFLEAKGPYGTPAVASLQACYDGAIGARGIHSLQSYRQQPIYDNKAYTITSTYQAGTLILYTSYPTAPRASDGRPEYIMTQLTSWSLTGNIESLRQGVSAYRNAREWAKEQRDRIITAANERHARKEGSSEPLSTSEHEVISGRAETLEDTNTSTSDEHELFHDAEISFAHSNDSDEAPQPSNKRTRN